MNRFKSIPTLIKRGAPAYQQLMGGVSDIDAGMTYKVKEIVSRKLEGVNHFHYYLCRQLKGSRMEISMKVLRIKNIEGIYNEMFFPYPKDFIDAELKIENNYLDANTFFWSLFFKKEQILNILKHLEENIHCDKYNKPQFLAIINEKEKFLELALAAPIKICDTNISPKDFFSCLETMQILCNLNSEFLFPYFPLSIQNGYELESTSAKNIYLECTNPKSNPYYFFIKKHIMPLILENKPEIIIFEGKISYYSMCIAMLSRRIDPKIHISVSKHSTEYYSLNKITKNLQKNTFLFKMIDSIILEYFAETEKHLISALENNLSLNSVFNLIYRNKDGLIIETKHRAAILENKMVINSDKTTNVYANVLNVHFSPYTKCPWNKCTFCGINKKYHFEDIQEKENVIEQKVNYLCDAVKQIPYMWLIDEALPPFKLELIAKKLIENKCDITWEARCRADISLVQNNLPMILAQSGLKELRIGLESASYYILKQMNKFDENFNLDIIEKIISVYSAQNISIHCPIIIGFPTENKIERQKTYDFLSTMKKKYPLFTFNINILDLDVSSKLFKEWNHYTIENIKFPCNPDYYIGNSVAWITEKELDTLCTEREQFTLNKLYPWMPRNSFIKPSIFYRLSETSRNTLRWKDSEAFTKLPIFSTDMSLILSPYLSIVENKNLNLIYNLYTHHFMYGNSFLLEILNCFKSTNKVSVILKKLYQKNSYIYNRTEVLNIIKKLFFDGYLLGTYTCKEINSHLEIKKAYDEIYSKLDGVYEETTDMTLLQNKDYISFNSILEVGVGLGKNIDYLLSKNSHIDAIDISDVAINYLKNKYNNPLCNFMVGDICKINIKKNSYSLIICSMILSYLNEIELVEVIEKIKESLQVGGCIYIVDLSEKDPLKSMISTYVVDKRYFRSVEQITQLFEGFEIIEIKNIYKKSSRRLIANGYYGISSFLGRKVVKGGE